MHALLIFNAVAKHVFSFQKTFTAFQIKICAVDEVVTASDIDTFVLVFVGWFAFGGLVLAAIHFLLRK